MKHIKAKIAAVVFAAATAVCSMQAATASALYTGHENWYSAQSQDERELQRNFAHDLYFIQNSYANQTTWNGTVYSGMVLGTGYTYANISGTQTGSALTGAAGWARNLANRFYGSNVIYTEQPHDKITSFGDWRDVTLGDQIVMHRNGSQHTVIVTGINSETGKFYCSELVGNKIYWGREFTKIGTTIKRVSGNTSFTFDYVIRPVKVGDANGDSIVGFTDATWLDYQINYIGMPNFGTVCYEVYMAAVDFNNNWSIDAVDATEIFQHYGYGRMQGSDYKYVTTWHNN